MGKRITRGWAWAAVVALLQACTSAPIATPSPEAEPAAPPPAVHSTPAPSPSPPASPAPAAPAPVLLPFKGEHREVHDRLRGVKLIDRTVQPNDLWQRIRDGFAMPDIDNARVRAQMAYYISRPEYLQRVFERSRLYLYHIVDECEKRGLPTEIALLPMVESAFNPLAYSRAHASGLWQFVPGTGKRYELEQNWWYDGRRDIVDSTSAALDYLTDLYDMYGDWQLALASYNWGENAVARAIARNRARGLPADYAHLRMPPETRNYLPKLQALKNIISDPAPFGIQLDPIPNRPYFATITKTFDIDVRLAAKLAEMPVDQFMALNPGFSRPLIRAAVTPRIVLPADKVDVFHENLTKYNPRSLVSWQAYRPQRHESLVHIARKFGLSLTELRKVNGLGRWSRTPSLLVVPIRGKADRIGNAAALPIMYAPPIPVRGAVRAVHTVRRGDTLSGIARRYHVRVIDLKRWNRLGRFLQIGQKILIR